MEDKGKHAKLSATVSCPKPADFPVRSAGSRAAARAMLNTRPKHPIIIVHFVSAKDRTHFDEADIDGQVIRLAPGESQVEFEARATKLARSVGRPVILMSCRHDIAGHEIRDQR